MCEQCIRFCTGFCTPHPSLPPRAGRGSPSSADSRFQTVKLADAVLFFHLHMLAYLFVDQAMSNHTTRLDTLSSVQQADSSAKILLMPVKLSSLPCVAGEGRGGGSLSSFPVCGRRLGWGLATAFAKHLPWRDNITLKPLATIVIHTSIPVSRIIKVGPAQANNSSAPTWI